MTVQMERIDRRQIADLISSCGHANMTENEWSTLNQCMVLTASLWVGLVDGKLACIWGLVPPTLMSEQAYLWLYITEEVHSHEFLFVRNSQRAVEKMLEEFPLIVGHTNPGAPKTVRWLQWLGATFGEPDGRSMPFQIRKK